MKSIFITILLIFQVLFLFSKNYSVLAGWNIKPFERKAFIENKGEFNQELPQQYQNFDYAIDNNSRILFTKKGLTYVIKKRTRKKLGLLSVFMSEEKREDKEHDFNIEYEYITMNWVNANSNCVIETQDESSASYNYMLSSETNPHPYTETCKGYHKIIYKNIYNGIDIEYFFTERDGFKYNIIAEAGADLSQLKMQYDSKTNVSLTNQGDIQIKTINGNITEKSPFTYLTNNTQQKINSSFHISKNSISFQINNPSHQAITIDPFVITPSSATPVFDNGVDNSGNIYIYIWW